MTIRRKLYSNTAFLIIFFFLAVPVFAHVEEGHMPDAVAEVEYKILLEFKPRDLDIRTKLALVLIRLGKLDDAEKELDKAGTQAPDDYRVFEGYIVLRLKQQKAKEALTLAQKAVKTVPEEAILYLHYGTALEANGQNETALAIYETGLEKAIDNKNEHDRQQLEVAINKLKATQTDNTAKNR